MTHFAEDVGVLNKTRRNTMNFWILTIIFWIPTTIIASLERFWRDQPKPRTFSEKTNKIASIVFSSFLLAFSLSCWVYSIRAWNAADARKRSPALSETTTLNPEKAARVWEYEHSARPETYPSDARPNDPWIASPSDASFPIDSEYEYKIRPGYASKF